MHGARSDSGPTYDGGRWTGGGERTDKTLAVRLWTPMGRPASVWLDLGDNSHGCTVALTPDHAREAARALREAADRADAEMARWQAVLDRNRAEALAAVERDMLGRVAQPADRDVLREDGRLAVTGDYDMHGDSPTARRMVYIAAHRAGLAEAQRREVSSADSNAITTAAATAVLELLESWGLAPDGEPAVQERARGPSGPCD